MSKPQVTITLGRSGRVVKRAGSASDAIRSEYIPSSGNKRPIRDRLGTNSDNLMLYDGPDKTKRQRSGRHWSSLSDYEAIGQNQFGTHIQVNRDDLRYMLMQKKSAMKSPRTMGPSVTSSDRREHKREEKPPSLAPRNISWPPDTFMRSPVGGLSPPRSIPRPADLSRTGHTFPPKKLVQDSRPASTSKPVASVVSLKPAVRFAPPGGVVQKTSYSAEEPVTVAGLLHSLGLGKYAIPFQAEEVDMTALRQMGDKDLKELGIPMGPRKKILLAVLPRPKHRST